MQRKPSRGQDLYRKGAVTSGPITSEIKMKQTPEMTSVAALHYLTLPATHLPTHQITHLLIISLSTHLLIDLPSTHQSVIYSPTRISIYPLRYSSIYRSNHPSIHLSYSHPSIHMSIHSSLYVAIQPSPPPPRSLSHKSPPWEALGKY